MNGRGRATDETAVAITRAIVAEEGESGKWKEKNTIRGGGGWRWSRKKKRRENCLQLI